MGCVRHRGGGRCGICRYTNEKRFLGVWLVASRFGSLPGRLGRAPSTVSREVARNDGRGRYRAHRADRAAWGRARRPQRCKLATNPKLRAEVEDKLAARWSPQQISGWLRHTYPDVEAMHVSHETIYLTLFIQARGGLKRELTQHLRTRKANRRPKGTKPPSNKGRIVDPVMISERPAAVEDRTVPGHWEGDLLMGRRQTAIGNPGGTLVPLRHALRVA